MKCSRIDCYNQFDSASRKIKYCSRHCQVLVDREKIKAKPRFSICPQCGVQFQARGTKKYCSRGCSQRNYADKIHAQVLLRQCSLKPKKCAREDCSNLFTPPIMGEGIRSKKYCSQKCHSTMSSRSTRKRLTPEKKAQNNEKVLSWQRTSHGRYRRLLSTARKRKIDISLTEDQYGVLLLSGICCYCSGDIFGDSRYGTVLDRYDRTKGYTLENSRPCCWRCNEAKGHLESAGFPPTRAVELLKELIQGDLHASHFNRLRIACGRVWTGQST
jgi:5-methylcytosine-specific restriction endonuclease McrA